MSGVVQVDAQVGATPREETELQLGNDGGDLDASLHSHNMDAGSETDVNSESIFNDKLGGKITGSVSTGSTCSPSVEEEDILADVSEVPEAQPGEGHSTVLWEASLWALKAFLLVIIWGSAFVILMPKCFKQGIADCQHPALPGGVVFDLMCVLVIGFLGGYATKKMIRLPPLLGMLMAGFVLKNLLGQLNGIGPVMNSTLRNMALATIMLRAGLGLNIKKLRQNGATTILMSFVPCICEAGTIALAAKVFFPSVTLPFALMLGFCIADVSPAVTTPILLDFMSQGLGVSKGIPSILLAAGSVNSVVAIVFYSVMWEFAWTESVSGEKLAEIIAVKLVLQIVGIGLIAGLLLGRITEFSWRFASNDTERFVLALFMSMLTLFGFKSIGMGGGGTLAVVTLGATLKNSARVLKEVVKPVDDLLASSWQLVGSVVLFTLLGASIDREQLDANMVLMAAGIVIVGLVGRMISVLGLTTIMIKEWNLKERAFALVAQCPKATVQAALATVALDYVNAKIASGQFLESDPFTQNVLRTSNIILTTAVLSIVMTAPLFAVLMVVCGNSWLTKRSISSDDLPC
jgi:NhaP-type Na+/H+ or K+/H+ antiporter